MLWASGCRPVHFPLARECSRGGYVRHRVVLFVPGGSVQKTPRTRATVVVILVLWTRKAGTNLAYSGGREAVPDHAFPEALTARPLGVGGPEPKVSEEQPPR